MPAHPPSYGCINRQAVEAVRGADYSRHFENSQNERGNIMIMINTNNIWLGGNELMIVNYHGTYAVLEAYQNYLPVFVGKYRDCMDYMQKEWEAYQESIIG